jgi:hypothetical protein
MSPLVSNDVFALAKCSYTEAEKTTWYGFAAQAIGWKGRTPIPNWLARTDLDGGQSWIVTRCCRDLP